MKRTLSSREKEVMAVIFDSTEELSLHDILTNVNERFGHDWKPQTVSTFLARCVKKGCLTSRREGRFVYYKPVIEEDDMLVDELNDVVQLYFNGNKEAFAEKVKILFE